MAYDESNKTGRIALLCGTMIMLGFFFFLFKVEACKGSPYSCKDEFFEIKTDTSYGNHHSCSPGATVEVVTSPPAPRPGIICHCAKPSPEPASTK